MDLFQTHSQRLLENNTFTCTPHSPLNYTIVPLQASSNSRTYSVLQLDARMTNHFNESTTMVPVSNIRDTAIKGGTAFEQPGTHAADDRGQSMSNHIQQQLPQLIILRGLLRYILTPLQLQYEVQMTQYIA